MCQRLIPLILLLLLPLALPAQSESANSTQEIKQLQNQITELKRQNIIAIGAGILLLVLAIWGRRIGLSQIMEHANEQATMKVREEIKRIAEGKSEQLQALISQLDVETRIKKQFGIVCLSADQAGQQAINSLLAGLGFSKVVSEVATDYDKSHVAKADIILFNCSQGDDSLSVSLMEQYLADETTLFLYYGMRFNGNRAAYNHRLSFANSAITLYPRLMEIMKFLQAQHQASFTETN